LNQSNFPPDGVANKPTLAIDFDGVIHNSDKGYNDGTCYGNPIPGSIEAIKFLSKKYEIYIHTAKARKDRPLIDGKTGADLVYDWLMKHGVTSVHIVCVTAVKPRADYYIDDHAIKFTNWEQTLKELGYND